MGAEENERTPIVLVCGYPPTSTIGGGIILRTLLGAEAQSDLTVVANASVIEALRDAGGLLSVPHVGIEALRSQARGLRRLWRSLSVLQIFSASDAILRAAGARGVVLAVPWGGELGSELFVAAYLARIKHGIPLLVYEVDEWGASLGRASGRIARLLERTLHSRILRAADEVWAMNPLLAEELHAKSGVRAKVVPYGVDLALCGVPRTGERVNSAELRIVYTGAIYGAQADAIRRLVKALPAGAPFNAVLEIYTDAAPERLEEIGIAGEQVRVRRRVDRSALMEVLRASDVLFLPFSFEAAEERVVATSFPTKTTEYLASGVPILVHAPAYSTIARLSRAEGWALVVDRPSSELLGEAVCRLALDQSLRQALSANATRIALERHDSLQHRNALRASVRRLSSITRKR
jgi:glycosyltransferase involved in cell wall biosynthesis